MLQIISYLLLLLTPQLASAHSFGRLYNLPVPFSLYLFGGAGAMVVSFLFIGYFLDKKEVGNAPRKKDITENKIVGFFLDKRFKSFLKFASFALFILTILSGLFGESAVYSNWSMTFFWIIFMLGLTYLTAIFGNIYPALNPWATLTDWVVGKDSVPVFQYPKKLSYWPALFFYFAFIWIELIGHSTPSKLALILIAYTILNDVGVVLWGKDIWYKYCEFFSVFFRMISKVAPIYFEDGRAYLRPPFRGILSSRAEDWSQALFVIFMLASTALDGFKETIVYTTLYFRNLDDIFRPIFGNYSYSLFSSLSLLLAPLIFFGLFIIFIGLAKHIVKSDLSLKEVALQFTFSLIPIALVYHVAHYYTLLFTDGPGIIRLISDPFGRGMDLFGTASYRESFILPINFIWHSQVALILVGHIVGVYLTHIVVLKIFPNNKRRVMSQIPMLVLMVTLTCIGLWILAQPIQGGTL